MCAALVTRLNEGVRAFGAFLSSGDGRQLGFRAHGGIFQPVEPSLATSNTLAKGVP